MGDMTYRQLGDSGLTVSTVGLGCNQIGRRLDLAGTRAVVDAAIEAGITLFDTAEVYGSSPGACEDLLGQALEGRRDRIILATKFGMPTRGLAFPAHEALASRRSIKAAVEGSLRRLRTDYIDLYQMHRPDDLTPIEETLAALDDLVHEGKVRYIGSSQFVGWQVIDADWTARTNGGVRFVSTQNQYSLLERGAETELLPAAEHVGVGFIPFYPLARGLLTGKYQRGEAAPEGTRLAGDTELLEAANWDVIEALQKFAAARGISMLEVAIGGLAAQPGVSSIIVGATKPEQVFANANAAAWQPASVDLVELDSITGSARRS
jgi:aryl-alcohol dehydrogenase-like predicted oxidoreductase